MLNNLILPALILAALPMLGQSPDPPWTLTTEERISFRTTPELAQQRVRAVRIQSSAATSQDPGRNGIVDSFNGRTHPELFLPHEVFRNFMKTAFRLDAAASQLFRDDLMKDVKRHGLPSDFWPRLQSLAFVYLSDIAAEEDIGRSLIHQPSGRRIATQQALALKQNDVCRSAAKALADARSAFGRERFDRFLYESIAVNMHYAANSLSEVAVLRRLEGGCQ